MKSSRRPSEDRRSVTIVGAPELHFLPIAPDLAKELIETQALIAQLGPNMPKEAAKKLSEMSEKYNEDVSLQSNPWFIHALNLQSKRPILLLEVNQPSGAKMPTKFDKVELSMIAGGREIELYEGALPFK